MGYQVTFKPSAEKMEEYKPWTNKFGTNTYQSQTKKTRAELIAYCMKRHDDKTFTKIYDDISFYLRMLKESERTDTRIDAYNRWNDDENKELWYCGWQFSRPCEFDIDDVVDNAIEDLVMFTDIIQTPDYFENSEKFYDKYNEIVQKVDGFIELINEITIHEIIEDLDEFKCKYDDNDENE